MRSQILISALFSAFTLASPAPVIDPMTVTSLTPAEKSAYEAAQSPLITSLGPALASLGMYFATNTAALDAFNAVNSQLSEDAYPTGTSPWSRLDSLIDVLPTEIQPVYRTLVSAELSLLSSVVNDGEAAATSTGGSGVSSQSSGGSLTTGSGGSTQSSGSAQTGVSQQSANAAPTSGFVKAAGLAAGALVAGIAML